MTPIVEPFIMAYLPIQDYVIFLAYISLGLVLYRTILYPLLHGWLSNVPGPWLNKITSLHLAYYDLRYCRNAEILKWHQRYGPVVCISPNEVSVATLEAVQKVYTATNGWSKSDYFDNFMGYNQRSVFAAKPYQEHREKRKLTSAFYQATTIYKLPELELYIHNRCQAIVKKLERVRVADVYSLTDWYALDNITYLVFGSNHGTHCVEGPCQERTIMEDLKRVQFTAPFRVRFPGVFACTAPLLARLIPRLNYLQAEEALAEWCLGRISAAIDDPSLFSSRSLLRQLLQVQAKVDGKALDRGFIAAELLDNVNAARATVAVTATYLIWLLSVHREWQHKVREELRALPTQPDGSVSFATINSNARVLESCLREVYRLYPASSGRAERIVPKGGCTLSGVHLPEGCTVTSSILALHLDGDLFPDPEVFDPRRWLEIDDVGLKLRDSQLIPFGYGGRICLGKALATMEVKMLAAAMYLNYETTTTLSCTPASMRQCSTHDAVPRAAACMIEFRKPR
jgi:cytochrome P450